MMAIHKYEVGEREAEDASIPAPSPGFPDAVRHAAALVASCGLSRACYVARHNAEYATDRPYWSRVLAVLMDLGAAAEEGVN